MSQAGHPGVAEPLLLLEDEELEELEEELEEDDESTQVSKLELQPPD